LCARELDTSRAWSVIKVTRWAIILVETRLPHKEHDIGEPQYISRNSLEKYADALKEKIFKLLSNLI